jgi:hypothetical protein
MHETLRPPYHILLHGKHSYALQQGHDTRRLFSRLSYPGRFHRRTRRHLDGVAPGCLPRRRGDGVLERICSARLSGGGMGGSRQLFSNSKSRVVNCGVGLALVDGWIPAIIL